MAESTWTTIRKKLLGIDPSEEVMQGLDQIERSPAMSPEAATSLYKELKKSTPGANVSVSTSMGDDLPATSSATESRNYGYTPEKSDVIKRYFEAVMPRADKALADSDNYLSAEEKMAQMEYQDSLGRDTLPNLVPFAQLGEVLTGKKLTPLAQYHTDNQVNPSALQAKLMKIRELQKADQNAALKSFIDAYQSGAKMSEPSLLEVLKNQRSEKPGQGPKVSIGDKPTRTGQGRDPKTYERLERFQKLLGPEYPQIAGNLPKMYNILAKYPKDIPGVGPIDRWKPMASLTKDGQDVRQYMMGLGALLKYMRTGKAANAQEETAVKEELGYSPFSTEHNYRRGLKKLQEDMVNLAEQKFNSIKIDPLVYNEAVKQFTTPEKLRAIGPDPAKDPELEELKKMEQTLLKKAGKK